VKNAFLPIAANNEKTWIGIVLVIESKLGNYETVLWMQDQLFYVVRGKNLPICLKKYNTVLFTAIASCRIL